MDSHWWQSASYGQARTHPLHSQLSTIILSPAILGAGTWLVPEIHNGESGQGHGRESVQGISIRPFPGLVNCVPAVAYLLSLNLPAASSQPGNGLTPYRFLAHDSQVIRSRKDVCNGVSFGVMMGDVPEAK